ncbi:MAG: sugar phosphate isomerase/epimerase [Saprospiraceae bacterium]
MDRISIADSNSGQLEVSIFSKHLQFLDWKEAGQIAAELGFDGLDLTVRPKGHVLPENAKTDLPQAIRDIEAAGSSCKMITTAIESVDNPLDLEIVQTAAQNGVSFYRINWYKYAEETTMPQSIDKYKNQIYRLGKLNKKHNIVGCYQNHAGTKIGASYWEIYQLLEKVDPKYFGTQFDIRHATVDSGYSWTNGLKLLQEHIKVIALKDFKWGKVDGQWTAVNVPIGEGIVDFKQYFKLLKSYGLNPPVSLHLEYPLGGADKGKYEITVDPKVVYEAMKKDLKAIHKLWQEA